MPKASKNLQRVLRPYYLSIWSYKEIHILPKQNGRFIYTAFVFEQEEEAHFTNLGQAIGIDFDLNHRATCVIDIGESFRSRCTKPRPGSSGAAEAKAEQDLRI